MAELIAPYKHSLGYIILPVEIPELPATITLGDTTYQGKTHYHCSLLAFKKLAPLLIERDGLAQSEAEAQIVSVADQIITNIRPALQAYLPEFRVAEKPSEQKRTLLIMAKVSGMEEIFTHLSNELGLTIPVQPAHVTLCTMSNEKNVGLTSPDELTRKSRLLTSVEAQELKEQIAIQQIFGVTL